MINKVHLKCDKYSLFYLLLIIVAIILSTPSIFAAQYLQENQVKELMTQDRYPEAIELLKKMILLKPKNLDWQMQLANLYRKNHQYEDALSLYNNILLQKPKHQDALMGKAYIERSQKNFNEAKKLANQVLTLNSQNVDALDLLADLEKRELHYKESRSLYKQVLQIQPANTEAQEGLKALDDIDQRVSHLERNVLGPLAAPLKHWQIEAGGGLQQFNYNSSAPDAYGQVIYKQPHKYYLLGRLDYLDKFGNQSYQFTGGGGYYVHPRIILNDAVSVATNDIVTPRVQNVFEIDGVLPKGFMPYLRETFRHYDGIDVNTITPGFQWYYSNWFILDLNYSLAINNYDNLPAGRTDSSFGGKLFFIPFENRLSFFVYYARTEESFDTGNSLQFGRFHANIVGGGFEGFFTDKMGLRFYTDYENRDNGQTVNSYYSAFLYRF